MTQTAWRASKARRCARCASGSGLMLHHVVYEQHVRRAGGDTHDPRDGLTLCLRCHTDHHQSVSRRLRLSELRLENIVFAFELLGVGAGDYLRRYYVNDAPYLVECLVRGQPPIQPQAGERRDEDEFYA